MVLNRDKTRLLLLILLNYNGNPVQPTPVPHPIEQNLCSYPICKSEQPSHPLQLFGCPIPPEPGKHVLKTSTIATGKQDFPVKWFKFIHPSPKPRMTETPVQKPVHVAYSPIASMNYQWTINLHDGYPLLQVMQTEEYIPPTFHTLSNHKPTMFHLGDDNLCPHTFLLPPEENGEKLRARVTRNVVELTEKADWERVENSSYSLGIGNKKLDKITSCNLLVDHLDAAVNDENKINDVLYKFRALIGHQRPLKATDLILKGCKNKILVAWETGEKIYEPLSVLETASPVTLATYDGWKRYRTLSKRDKHDLSNLASPKGR